MKIGATASLALVIVLAAAAPAAADASVSIGDNFYAPATVTINPGETVTWSQDGQQPHTVTATDGSFDSSPNCPNQVNQCMQSGDTYSQTFTSSGNFQYFCKVHGEAMSGTVNVVVVDPTAPPDGDDGGGALPSTGPSDFARLYAPVGALLLLTGGLVLRVLGRRRRA